MTNQPEHDDSQGAEGEPVAAGHDRDATLPLGPEGDVTPQQNAADPLRRVNMSAAAVGVKGR